MLCESASASTLFKSLSWWGLWMQKAVLLLSEPSMLSPRKTLLPSRIAVLSRTSGCKLSGYCASMLESLSNLSLQKENSAWKEGEERCEIPTTTVYFVKKTASQTTKRFPLTTTKAPVLLQDYHLNHLTEESMNYVSEVPRAGRLYEEQRHRRVKRMGCQACRNGVPLAKHKRAKRSLCVPCTYLQPQYSENNPLTQPSLPQSPVGVPVNPAHRAKREGCLPHPECLLHSRRYKRNLVGSQYCEPCNGFYGRRKRETEIDECHKDRMERTKRSAEDTNCDVDEFDADGSHTLSSSLSRMKRQAYSPKGILDIVKVFSKTMANEGPNSAGCMKFPACVLMNKRRRKRYAGRVSKWHEAVKSQKEAVKKHRVRVKRQFFAPDAAASCVPCPAWVTLALASRKKRAANETDDFHEMTISEAIADIRKRKGYKMGFDDEDQHKDRDSSEEAPRRKQSCVQTEDCLNDIEYAVFQKVYHNSRTKREAIFRRKKCQRCGDGSSLKRVKRNFGLPNINASEQNCLAFPECRHRYKRSFFDDCNICTPDTGLRKKRKKRTTGATCYPCPGTKGLG
ncbi:hypothetical protein WR25_06364 isoform G [Diploscapter pachys]|uniref:Uncharacterized protein n=1 Tax=Diploscapter pachys TaxID=2018661 RepID=A0A2A2KME4_9BILA|nr:hypothetical protein WR25_06364 isoform C [Diploscapter pachys]PAV75038.1 hypothetical protein WR25_06364 isoform E [Diploscapter pachys]PAV75040.1 hypothetical protein WR25_06364 isoform G [Diploscapter pachys]